MKLAFFQLKKILPELNRKVINPPRIFQIFKQRSVFYYELSLEENGYYVSDSGRDFVFLKNSMRQMLFHETLLHEGIHAFTHTPSATFLRFRQELEAETFSLIAMMPISDLPRLNRIKNQLDAESYDLLMRRNKANSIWRL